MDRRTFVRVVMVGVAGLTFNQTVAMAASLRHNERPNSAAVRPPHMPLAGRVVAVRRLTRELTIRTASGSVRNVLVAADATVRARGAAGLNAVRSGVKVELVTIPGHNGQAVARSVIVR